MRTLILAALAAVWSVCGALAQGKLETAIFAGGCFWCVESDFDHVPGVLETVSGYTGGTSDNPTYENHVHAGHMEAVRITFDPSVISYAQMLDIFWHSGTEQIRAEVARKQHGPVVRFRKCTARKAVLFVAEMLVRIDEWGVPDFREDLPSQVGRLLWRF